MEFGQTLKEAREKRGLTLEAAEEATKIRRRYLKALEEENIKLLPEEVYSVGFLKNYARFLGLDPEPLVHELKNLYPPTREEPLEYVPPVQAPLRRRRPFLLAVVILIAAALAVYLFREAPPANEPPPAYEPPAAEEDTSVPPPANPDPAGTGVFLPEDTGQETGPPEGLTVELAVPDLPRADCWVQVWVDGQEVFQGTMTSGQVKVFEAGELVEVTMGDAGELKVKVNDQDLGLQGKPGEVVRKRVFKAPE